MTTIIAMLLIVASFLTILFHFQIGRSRQTRIINREKGLQKSCAEVLSVSSKIQFNMRAKMR